MIPWISFVDASIFALVLILFSWPSAYLYILLGVWLVFWAIDGNLIQFFPQYFINATEVFIFAGSGG